MAIAYISLLQELLHTELDPISYIERSISGELANGQRDDWNTSGKDLNLRPFSLSLSIFNPSMNTNIFGDALFHTKDLNARLSWINWAKLGINPVFNRSFTEKLNRTNKMLMLKASNAVSIKSNNGNDTDENSFAFVQSTTTCRNIEGGHQQPKVVVSRPVELTQLRQQPQQGLNAIEFANNNNKLNDQIHCFEQYTQSQQQQQQLHCSIVQQQQIVSQYPHPHPQPLSLHRHSPALSSSYISSMHPSSQHQHQSLLYQAANLHQSNDVGTVENCLLLPEDNSMPGLYNGYHRTQSNNCHDSAKAG